MADFVITLAFPVCRNMVGGTDGVCAACCRDLEFVTPPICHRTGISLAEAPGPEGVGLAAMINPPPYHRARLPPKYTDIGAQLIRREI